VGKASKTVVAGACVAISAAVLFFYSERQSQLAAGPDAKIEALSDTLEAKTRAKEEQDALDKQRAATLTPELCGQFALATIPTNPGDPPLTRQHDDDLRLCDDLGRLGEHDRDQLSSSGAL
jgi:hypothetical protein